MKRLALLLLLVTTPAFAFNTSLTRGDRVGVLRPTVLDASDERVAYAVSAYLARELRDRGLDAYDAKLRFDDLRDSERVDADFYVEVVSGNGDTRPYGGIGIGSHSVGVDVAVVVARVAARLRIYDGRTLDVLDEYDLQGRNTTVMPTAIGVGRRHFAAWIALPMIHSMRYRSAARAVAQEAARMIAAETVQAAGQ